MSFGTLMFVFGKKCLEPEQFPLRVVRHFDRIVNGRPRQGAFQEKGPWRSKCIVQESTMRNLLQRAVGKGG